MGTPGEQGKSEDTTEEEEEEEAEREKADETAEVIKNLKVKLTQRKGVITRHVSKLRRLVSQRSKGELSYHMSKCELSFDEFEELFDVFRMTSNYVDDGTFNESWFADVLEGYLKEYGRASAFLDSCVVPDTNPPCPKTDQETKPISCTVAKSPSVPTNPDSNTSSKNLLDDLNSVINLPKVEIVPFDGDPLRYHAFINSFMINVDRVCSDPDAKIARLISCTRGSALEAIRGVQIKGGEEGYKRALARLKELFGSKHCVTQAVVSQLVTGKPAKSADHVRTLSYQLTTAHDILSDLDALDEVNSQIIIRMIVDRLPSFGVRKWEKKQLDSKKKDGCYLKFPALVDFVKDLESDMNDPLCGNAAKQNHKALLSAALSEPAAVHEPSFEVTHSVDSQKESFKSLDLKQAKKNRPSKNVVAHTDSSAHAVESNKKEPCALCGQAHFLTRCDEFKRMSVSDRLSFVKQKRFCFNCLRAGHGASRCTFHNRCLVCNEKHSAFLHSDQMSSSVVNISHFKDGNERNYNTHTFLPVVRVRVNDAMWVLAALDTCSTSTFCSRSLADALALPETPCFYRLGTLSGESSTSSSLVTFEVSSCSLDDSVRLSGVKVIDSIPVPSGHISIEKYPHLQGIDLSANIDCRRVDLLIGQDNADFLIPLEIRRGKAGEPHAVKYKFGWTLNGCTTASQTAAYDIVCHYVSGVIQDAKLPCDWHRDLDKLWAIEHDQGDYAMSVSDHEVISFWDQHCKKNGAHYEIPIPWKDISDPLPNNFCVAKKRLDSLLGRLSREGIYDRYDREIQNLLDDGYAEVVPPAALRSATRVWYLPHHCVFNPNKPDKMRIVFDCASRFQGKSLNERCHQGPDLINSLFAILLRFRLYCFAIQADIKAMYHQVKVPLCDRDALRFLWVRNDCTIHLRMTSHLFGGIWCSAISTYALRRTVLDHEGALLLLKQVVLRSMYVDDCLLSVSSKEDASLVINDLPVLLRTGGFELTKFVVNDPDLLRDIPVMHRAKEVHEFSSKSVGKALGVKWKIQEDAFVYSIASSTGDRPLTRRLILKFVSSLFDPIGLISPWLLHGRLLFQMATRLKVSWDEQVPEDLAKDWDTWIQSLRTVNALSFPRCLITPIFLNGYYEYHVFCDASESAYGVCIYLRCSSAAGRICSNLFVAKAFVAPVMRHSIPRLELQAAYKAVTLAATVIRESDLSLCPVYFWTDSMIVLGYISNESFRFRTFVANRISTIHSLSKISQWRHVKTDDNPSDLLTRPNLHSSFQMDFWMHGPDWLERPNAFWMKNVDPVSLSEDDSELVREKQSACITEPRSEGYLDLLYRQLSSWTGMFRCVAWMRRFVASFKGVIRGPLSSVELHDARTVILRDVQRKVFPREYDALLRGSALHKSSHILRLNPYLDPVGVMRVGGRTGQHPIILSHDHPVSEGIVRHFHSNCHCGIEWTLAMVREKFWLTKSRRLIRKVIAACIKCKKLSAKPAGQLMADLPPERLQPNSPPFLFVGLDAFGPYNVAYKRSSVKRYGCIFTCMTTRAIHVEMLYSLDADSFLCAFKRFIARRGCPRKVFSDNGGNFVAGERELRKAFAHNARRTLAPYSSMRDIEWQFNPPAAPHMGGVWERMVGVFKRVFKGIISPSTRLTDEILSTVFSEVESIVNGRPLTKLSDDPRDLSPLTPNHLLLLRQSEPHPVVGTASDMFRCRWRFVQHLATAFWNRWVKEYLPLLQHRSRWRTPMVDIKVNDLVLVAESNLPRGLWPLAIVEEVFKGRDGRVRSATVRTRAGSFKRPVVRLVRLEVDG